MEGNPHKIELRDLYAQYITIKLRYKRTKNRWALESSEIPAGIEEIIGYQIPKEFSGGSYVKHTKNIIEAIDKNQQVTASMHEKLGKDVYELELKLELCFCLAPVLHEKT